MLVHVNLRALSIITACTSKCKWKTIMSGRPAEACAGRPGSLARCNSPTRPCGHTLPSALSTCREYSRASIASPPHRSSPPHLHCIAPLHNIASSLQILVPLLADDGHPCKLEPAPCSPLPPCARALRARADQRRDAVVMHMGDDGGTRGWTTCWIHGYWCHVPPQLTG